MDDRPQRLISDMRGVRYGEVLAVYLRDKGLEAEVWGTQMLNDCPQELWEGLDATAIAAEVIFHGKRGNASHFQSFDDVPLPFRLNANPSS